VTRSGYEPWSTELVVRQGIRYRVEQRLERRRGDASGARRDDAIPPRLTGELLLDVAPDDAIASLDGRLLGAVSLLRGGVALRTIPVGRHTLELRRPGYRTLTREIDLDAREPLRLKLALEPN
jgi:hypothetical protein